jgi:hypothetical protein
MATTHESSAPTGPMSSWALPMAATILVAGSLVFWTWLGMFWLASRPAPSAPIVIYMPAGADVADIKRLPVALVQRASAPEEVRNVATD